MLRAVLDTNVLISAVISDGKPRQLLRKGIENKFSLVTSDLILKELASVLRRPRFKTTEDEIQRIDLALIQSAEVVDVKSSFRVVKRDPKDDLVVNTAYDGKADAIVTGDRDLLELESFRGVRIISVADALGLM
ncbi:MAG: putative toxin-antitoxin system toxin component, PIN family [Thaumarchaeota archaeon]|nr:putative toxin-antitoxin system toxin component, PIN family [Nitrososphaerota archaeon]